MPIPVLGGSFFGAPSGSSCCDPKAFRGPRAPPTVVDSYIGQELSFGHGSEIHSRSM